MQSFSYHVNDLFSKIERVKYVVKCLFWHPGPADVHSSVLRPTGGGGEL